MDDKLKPQAEKYLTDIRLFRYYEMGEDDFLQHYSLNMEVSEKLLSIISIFEIIYRNKINMLLSTALGVNYLTDDSLNVFSNDDKGNIKRAFKKAQSPAAVPPPAPPYLRLTISRRKSSQTLRE